MSKAVIFVVACVSLLAVFLTQQNWDKIIITNHGNTACVEITCDDQNAHWGLTTPNGHTRVVPEDKLTKQEAP